MASSCYKVLLEDHDHRLRDQQAGSSSSSSSSGGGSSSSGGGSGSSGEAINIQSQSSLWDAFDSDQGCLKCEDLCEQEGGGDATLATVTPDNVEFLTEIVDDTIQRSKNLINAAACVGLYRGWSSFKWDWFWIREGQQARVAEPHASAPNALGVVEATVTGTGVREKADWTDWQVGNPREGTIFQQDCAFLWHGRLPRPGRMYNLPCAPAQGWPSMKCVCQFPGKPHLKWKYDRARLFAGTKFSGTNKFQFDTLTYYLPYTFCGVFGFMFVRMLALVVVGRCSGKIRGVGGSRVGPSASSGAATASATTGDHATTKTSGGATTTIGGGAGGVDDEDIAILPGLHVLVVWPLCLTPRNILGSASSSSSTSNDEEAHEEGAEADRDDILMELSTYDSHQYVPGRTNGGYAPPGADFFPQKQPQNMKRSLCGRCVSCSPWDLPVRVVWRCVVGVYFALMALAMVERGYPVLALYNAAIGITCVCTHIVLGRVLVDEPALLAWVLSVGVGAASRGGDQQRVGILRKQPSVVDESLAPWSTRLRGIQTKLVRRRLCPLLVILCLYFVNQEKQRGGIQTAVFLWASLQSLIFLLAICSFTSDALCEQLHRIVYRLEQHARRSIEVAAGKKGKYLRSLGSSLPADEDFSPAGPGVAGAAAPSSSPTPKDRPQAKDPLLQSFSFHFRRHRALMRATRDCFSLTTTVCFATLLVGFVSNLIFSLSGSPFFLAQLVVWLVLFFFFMRLLARAGDAYNATLQKIRDLVFVTCAKADRKEGGNSAAAQAKEDLLLIIATLDDREVTKQHTWVVLGNPITSDVLRQTVAFLVASCLLTFVPMMI